MNARMTVARTLAMGLMVWSGFNASGQTNDAVAKKAQEEQLIKTVAFRWVRDTIGKGESEKGVLQCDYPFNFDGQVVQTAEELKAALVKNKEPKSQELTFHEKLTTIVDTKEVASKVEGFSWDNIVVVVVHCQKKIEKVETVCVLVRVLPKDTQSIRIVGIKD